MEPMFNFFAHAWIGLFGIAALIMLVLGLYLLLNRKARKRRLAAARAKLNEMKPSDPEYNQVRALYTEMVIQAHRWDVFHRTDSADDGHAHHDVGSQAASDHSGGATQSD